MNRRIVPDVVNAQSLVTVTPSSTARSVSEVLATNRIAAVMVVEDDALKGIITERDITTRLVAAGRDPETTTAREIMTPDPDCLKPTDVAKQALLQMRERGYRHIPVVDDGKVVAMVSIRDLYAVVTDALESEVKHHEAFIFGESYGTAG